MSLTTHFKYPKFPNNADDGKYFRILTLHPGQHQDLIYGDLEICRLDAAQSYEALSYYWGELDVSQTIQICGRDFNLSLELKIALEHLRYEHRSRRLWIDAICIDQHDLAERAQQVNVMRNIYQTAEQVIAWLGPERHASNEALEFSLDLVRRYGNEWARSNIGMDFATLRRQADEDARLNGIDLAPAPDCGRHQYLYDLFVEYVDVNDKRSDVDDVDRGPLPAQDRLFLRPWFKRAWVIQEVAVARRCIVQCGHSKINLGILRWGLKIAVDKFIRSRIDNSGIWFVMDYRKLTEAVNSIDDPNADIELLQLIEPLCLLTQYRQHHTTDPHDKIYAFMGLAKPDLKEWNFTVDYTRTFEETYKKFAIAHMEWSKKLHVLSISRNPELSHELPSWVPDWRDVSKQPWALIDSLLSTKKTPSERATTSFAASGPSSLDFKTRDTTRLYLKGYYVDSIEVVGSAMVDKDTDSEMSDLLNLLGLQHPKDEVMMYILRMRLLLSNDAQLSDALEEWSKIAGVWSPLEAMGVLSYPDDDPAWRTFLRTLLVGKDTQQSVKTCLNYLSLMRKRGEISHWAIKHAFYSTSGLDLESVNKGLVIETAIEKILELESSFPNGQSAMQTLAHMRSSIGHVFGRRFFKSANGRFGLAGVHAKIGDHILLLKGSDVPFLVRPHPKDDSAFELICELYLDSAMNGEIWDEKSCREIVLM